MKKTWRPYILILLIFVFGCDKEDFKEVAIADCVNTLELNPVCGCNGITYDNPSVAACNSITEFTIGTCD
ncbi:hypothetical protein [Eudoraea chungangensis]|uniref:hypothetical protein n=1 Tax=Eudoraea chungangensis TaxID=1481905 RepID=UPI0023ECD4D8|nr:hypothetical protein [Eudoraea chungangensis]